MDCRDHPGFNEPSTRRTLTDRFRRSAATSLALALITACDKIPALPKRDAAAKPNATSTPPAAPAKASIDLSVGGYSVASLASVGSVAGTLKLVDSASFGDTAALRLPECVTKRRGPAPLPANKQFGNTLVWIADAKTGKPMSGDKRTEISSERCVLDPRVQAVGVGTAVNVINDDKVLHKLVFTKFGTNDTLLVTPFFNSGEIVATERLAKTAGMVEVKCAQHPWEHGFIAVFDHPYYAVTEDDGTFKIDSLAPGSYKLMIWREGESKPTEQQVQITAGGTARIAR